MADSSAGASETNNAGQTSAEKVDDQDPVPTPEPIRTNRRSDGMMGAAVAIVVLGSLIGFAFLGKGCFNELLVPILAFGAAFLFVFVGGSAAVTGRLGPRTRAYAVVFSLGGGAAAFVIVLLIGLVFLPTTCRPVEALLSVENVPPTLQEQDNLDLWYKMASTFGGQYRRYTFRVPEGSAKGQIFFYREASANQPAVAPCELDIEFVGDVGKDNSFSQYHFTAEPADQHATHVDFSFDIVHPDKANPCYVVQKTGVDNLKVALNGDEFAYANYSVRNAGAVVQSGAADSGAATGAGAAGAAAPTAADTYGGLMVDPSSVLVGRAMAQSAPTPFAELKAMLLGADLSERVVARQQLSSSFPVYQADILAEILKGDPADTDYLGNLVSALIAGIDQSVAADTNGKPAPLSLTLPYIHPNEQRIVELTADPNPSVRKQARRLTQRYPVDAFVPVYDAVFSKAVDCTGLTDADKLKIYSGLFFEYDRMLGSDGGSPVTPDKVNDASAMVDRVEAAARCLDPSLRVDSALLYFGLSSIQRAAGEADAATRSAKNFLDVVAQNGGGDKYYLQSHVDLMKKLAG